MVSERGPPGFARDVVRSYYEVASKLYTPLNHPMLAGAGYVISEAHPGSMIFGLLGIGLGVVALSSTPYYFRFWRNLKANHHDIYNRSPLRRVYEVVSPKS